MEDDNELGTSEKIIFVDSEVNELSFDENTIIQAKEGDKITVKGNLSCSDKLIVRCSLQANLVEIDGNLIVEGDLEAVDI